LQFLSKLYFYFFCGGVIMKICFLLILATMTAFLVLPINAEPPKKQFENALDKRSYGMGLDMGKKFKTEEIKLNPDQFYKGLKDGLAGAGLLTDTDIQELIIDFNKEMRDKQNALRAAAAEKNKKIGEKFLEENKKKSGVITLPSGLQYKIIKEGNGPIPQKTDTVITNYRGTLIDGREFDSSFKRGKPATFEVGKVIAGWTEALQLMKTGSVWQLFIPSQLAYGERGSGQNIGPNETLIFEIELIGINKPK